jgi:membrane protein
VRRQAWKLIKNTVLAWLDDYAPSMGAAISYYTVFSIAPLLLIVMAVAGFVWGQAAIEGEMARQLTGLLGPEAAQGVQVLLRSANHPTEGLVAGGLSLLALLIGATTVFAELQSALDRIWQVHAQPPSDGLWEMLRTRLLSLGFILGMGFLLSVSLVVSTGLNAFGHWAEDRLAASQALLLVAHTGLSMGIATVLFAMMFKLLPRASVAWKDVWIGAGVTAALFEVGQMLIGLYLGQSSLSSSFAAAGSLVLLLVWVYYSAQIFLLGAEFTWVYAHEHGSRRGLAVGGSSKHQAAHQTGRPQTDTHA